MSLMLATTYVLGDEKAMGLYEMNLMSPMGFRRRYEIIRVIRDGKISEYRHDMGKVTKDDQIRIPSFMEHTVSELREMSQQVKFKPVDKLDLVGVNKIRETGTNN